MGAPDLPWLERVVLRAAWRSEARDFTSRLAQPENLRRQMSALRGKRGAGA
jgi:hypothetical protein